MKEGATLSPDVHSVSEVDGVPAYDVVEFYDRQSAYLVCVFVINEGERIREQLRRMRPYVNAFDIAIADGGSTDGSLDLDFLKSVGVRALLTKRDVGKLSAQMRMAFHYALQCGYSGVITIDGNGKDGVEALPRFKAALDEGIDHVQGSRYIPGGHHENTPLSRHLALKVLHAPLISAASGVRQTDTTNGFRAYSSRLISDPRIGVFRDIFQSYELHYHLAIEAGRENRFRTAEVPVSRLYPRSGKTPTKISPIRGNLRVLRILIDAARGKFRLAQEQDSHGKA